jgi:intracellular septation protein A
MGWLMTYSIQYMQAIHFIIVLVAGVMELSPRFDTKNFVKKIALMLIILGALASLAKKEQPLIELGLAFYLSVELCGAFMYRTFERRSPRDQRETERRVNT